MAGTTTKITFLSSKKSFPYAIDHLSISETFDRHHTFEMTVSLDDKVNIDADNVKRMLGEFIQIEVTSEIKISKNTKEVKGIYKNETHTFIGFIDSMMMFQQGQSQIIRIEGYSPTILMDSAPTFRVFSEKEIKTIAEEILKPYARNSNFPKTNFQTTGEVDFSVQTQETDYRYLCRLADQHGVNFFYDGKDLHFAPLKNIPSEKIELINNINLFHFRAAVNLSPVQFKVKGYNMLTDEMEESEYELKPNGNKLVKAAIEKSEVYPMAEMSLNYSVKSKKETQKVGEELATRQTNSLVNITGGSSSPAIKVGSILDLISNKGILPGFDKEENFVVTQVMHSISNGGTNYSNSFSAIPQDATYPVDMTGSKAPIIGPLMAEIVENNDPENLGRVRVRFLMDSGKDHSPWIRVLTDFTANGGHYFLPEKKEKVVVFFEDFNPEKSPFVIGSFFQKNKNAEQYADAGNKKKGFSTGDISFFFDENNGQLTIKAKSILIKTEEGVTMDAGKEIKQKAQEINIEADKQTKVSGGQGVKVSAPRIDLN